MIRSIPGAFFDFKVFITSFIPCSVRNLIHSPVWRGAFRACWTFFNWLSLGGEITSERCAKRSAVSWSLLTQDPGGVVNFRIGGDVISFDWLPGGVVLSRKIRDIVC